MAVLSVFVSVAVRVACSAISAAVASVLGGLPWAAELQHVPVEHVVVREALLVEQVAEQLSEVTANRNRCLNS